MNKVCFGCGSILQSDNEEKQGFIPENKMNDSNYCKRCFRLMHYGENKESIEKSTISILNNVNKDEILKIYLVDLLNINDNTIDLFNKIKGNKLLLISKLDLLNKSINKDLLINKIKNYYNIKSDVKFISTINNYGVKSLPDYLDYNHINKLYLLGITNSGKSTLINKLLNITNTKLNNLTTSSTRNTTLEFIRIKLNNDITLIDSPGFILDDYKLKTNYKNVIKPITFNMNDGEILKIDNFYLKFSKSTSITLYTYENIYIKKFYKEVNFDYDVNVNNNTDLCINGFGFICIKSKSLINISGLDKNLISTRNSLFGGNYE